MKNKKTKSQKYISSHLQMFFKIVICKNFANPTGKPQVQRPATLLKRDPNTGTLPKNLPKFQECLYSQKTSSGCFRQEQQQDNSKNKICNNSTGTIPQEFLETTSTHKIFNISYMKNFNQDFFWVTVFRKFNIYTVVEKSR